MAAKASSRNHRNNPYVLDDLAMQVHHSAAGTLWRFRTELAIITVAAGDVLFAHRFVPVLWAAVILTSLTLVADSCPVDAAVPHPARVVRALDGTACSGCSSRPACTPGRDGCPWSCASTPPKSGNAH